MPSRTAIDRSPESRTAIQDYDEIVFVVLVVVLIAVLIAVLIVVLDFRAIRTTTRTAIEDCDRFSQSSIFNSRTAKKRFEVNFDS